ncbi:MAG: hypothetical protein DME82_04975, partial [Verrucomicrobia bacterium]
MATVHDEIDNWLAADLYGELSEDGQRQLHTHLVDCAACRKTHQETKTMNKILEETLAQEKPDPAFEQRMLAVFRDRIPKRSGFVKLLSDLMRLRAAQITAVAAVLLGLVQLGRMITGETATTLRGREDHTNEGLFRQPAQVAATGQTQAGGLGKSDELAARQAKDMAVAKPEAAPGAISELRRFPATVAPANAAQTEVPAQETRS